MQIGIITGEYPPMQGGVGAFTQELALALHSIGHRIDILTTGTGTDNVAATIAGVVVRRTVPHWGASSVGRVKSWLRSAAPDIVSLQYEPAAYGMKGWSTALPCLLRHRPPLIITFHDLLPPYLFPKAGPLRTRSVFQMARRADGCIVTNEEDRQALVSTLGARCPDTRTIPIGSNITTELPPGYVRERTRESYSLRSEHLVVGFFGFLNRSKGIETLLQAIAHLRDAGHNVHLLLIGGRTGTSDASNAQYADELDELVRDLDLSANVHRTGFASQQEVSAALHAIDVCALPYRDGANLRRGTLHAALAHGCAIVTTAPRVPVDGLRHEAEVLFVAQEAPAALAQAILRLGADAALRRRLSEAAKNLAQRFSWPAIAAETADFYKSLI